MEGTKLLKVQKATQQLQKDRGLGEAALWTSHIAKPTMARVGLWQMEMGLPGGTQARGDDNEGRVSASPRGAWASGRGRKGTGRACGSVRTRPKKYKTRRKERKREREEVPPQQEQNGPSKTKYEPQLVDPLGAFGEGADDPL